MLVRSRLFTFSELSIKKPAWVVFALIPVTKDVTFSRSPNTRCAVVAPFVCTARSTTAPRTATVAVGVLNRTGVFLEILPPTRRKTPLVTLIAISPIPLAGSKINSSITISEPAPMVSEVPSRNNNWTRPAALVVTFSWKNTSRPVFRSLAGEMGGFPIASMLEAAVTPILVSPVAASVSTGALPARATIAPNKAASHGLGTINIILSLELIALESSHHTQADELVIVEVIEQVGVNLGVADRSDQRKTGRQ